MARRGFAMKLMKKLELIANAWTDEARQASIEARKARVASKMGDSIHGSTAHVEEKSQGARGTWPAQGPGRYVAVQIVPKGQSPLKSLNSRIAGKRGIHIEHFGEGYWNRTGKNSSLGMAHEEAFEFAKQHNAEHSTVE
jgi:hypothetical protein